MPKLLLVTDHDQVPIYLKPGYGFASAMMKWVHGKLIKNIYYKTDSGANIRHFSDFVPFCHILAPRYTLLYRKTDFGANIRHFSD